MENEQEKIKRKAEKVIKNNGSVPLAQLETTMEMVDKIEDVMETIKEQYDSKPEIQKVQILGLENLQGKEGPQGPQGEAGPEGPMGSVDIKADGKVIKKADTIVINGFAGRDGRDGKDGKDGKSVDKDEVIADVLSQIKLPEYKETVLDTPEQIVDKLNTLEEVIDQKVIKGLTQKISDISQNIATQSISSMPVTTSFVNGKRAKNFNFTGATVEVVGDTANITTTSGTSFTVGDIDGNPTVSNPTAIKFTNGSVTDNGDGTVSVTTGAGGGGDVSSSVGVSVDSEVAIFDGTGGKTIKRASATGIAKLTSGVLSAITPGTGIETWLATPSSANLISAVTDETGTGALVFGTSPDLTTPDINAATADSLQAGTTSAGLLLKNNAGTTVASFGVGSASSTNIALIGATTVTGNISATNLSGTNTGDQTSIVGITGTKAQFDTAVSDGNIVYTDAIGVSVQAYDADLTTWAGITPGTGVGTALAVNTGSAGAVVLFDGALGTPSSGTVTNLTGTASININGTVGATTGAFTTVSASGAITASTTIELGHATDTTLSRVSAGVVAIEGVNILTTATGLPLAGGTMTGNITLAENASIDLDPAASADGKYTGIAITGTAGAALAFGDLIYLDPTDSRWELVDANSASGADGDARGILGICVLAAAGDGSATKILLHGTVRADTAFPAMTINAPMYVSETAGDITGTQPTTTGAIIRFVGSALTADELYFHPDNIWFTHT